MNVPRRARGQNETRASLWRGPSGTLGAPAAWALLWSAVSLGGVRALSFLTTVALARVLVPEHFGLMTMAMAVVNLGAVVQDLGVQAALVFQRHEVPRAASAAFVMSVASGAALTALVIAAAPGVAWYFGDPQVAPVVVALAPVLLLNAAWAVPYALWQRGLRMDRVAGPLLLPVALSGAAAVALALAGLGVWSLVAGQHLRATLTLALLWRATPWRPTLGWDAPMMAALFRYARHVVVLSGLSFVVMNLDYWIAGRVLGPTALGLYFLAFQAATLPAAMLAQAVGKVTFPAYAALQDDPQRLRAAVLRTLRAVAFVTLPLGVTVAALAEPLVLALLGPRWAPAVDALRPLALFAALASLGAVLGDAYKGTGRPDVLWKYDLGKLAVLAPALLAGAQAGIAGVAAAHLAVAAAALPCNVYISTRVVGLRGRAVPAALAPPALCALAAGGVAVAGHALASPLGPLPALALAGGGAAALTLGWAGWWERSMVRDLWATRGRRPGAGQAAQGVSS